MTTDIRAECDPGKQTAVNRALFRELGLTVISIGSAPRAGRTTILERMLPFLEDEFKVAVLETDLHPALDVRRIRRAGAPVWHIVTGILTGSKAIRDVVRLALRFQRAQDLPADPIPQRCWLSAFQWVSVYRGEKTEY